MAKLGNVILEKTLDKLLLTAYCNVMTLLNIVLFLSTLNVFITAFVFYMIENIHFEQCPV